MSRSRSSWIPSVQIRRNELSGPCSDKKQWRAARIAKQMIPNASRCFTEKHTAFSCCQSVSLQDTTQDQLIMICSNQSCFRYEIIFT